MADIQIHAAWHYLVGSGGPFRRHYRFGTGQPPPHALGNETAACNGAVVPDQNCADPLSNRGTLPHLFTKLDCHPMKVLFRSSRSFC